METYEIKSGFLISLKKIGSFGHTGYTFPHGNDVGTEELMFY